MRAVKRHAQEIDLSTQQKLGATVRAYASEKQHWLAFFQQRKNFHYVDNYRKIRDEQVKAGYESQYGLPARLWKLAMQDALETMKRYWAAILVPVKSNISQNPNLNEAERHYANWLIFRHGTLASVLSFDYPVNPKILIDKENALRVGRYVARQLRKAKGKYPRIKMARSLMLDGSCYDVFVENNVQYLAMQSLEKGKRLVLPLKGRQNIREGSTIRVVLGDKCVEVHSTFETARTKPIPETPKVGTIDAGYTEVFTDDEGVVYGEGFGEVMAQESNRRHWRGKARNKLRRIAEKAKGFDDQKVRNIQQNNLGTQKMKAANLRAECTLSGLINAAFNTLHRRRKLNVVVSEDLTKSFSSSKPKGVNRKLFAWVKGVIRDRAEFKAQEKVFRLVAVNAAYTSQTCPQCGFVSSKNRNGDAFKCRNCKHEGRADAIAAINLLSRYSDPEIGRYTPYREVRRILESRFQRRNEACGGAIDPGVTVTAKTQDIVVAARSQVAPAAQKIQRTRAVGRSFSQRPVAPSIHSESEQPNLGMT